MAAQRNVYTQAVARGVKLLDRTTPDWFIKVDTDTLDLGNTILCVLGQVYGNFANRPSPFFIDVDRCGFCDCWVEVGNKPLLLEEWKRVIRERQAAVA
jgi:hypothetical protein